MCHGRGVGRRHSATRRGRGSARNRAASRRANGAGGKVGWWALGLAAILWAFSMDEPLRDPSRFNRAILLSVVAAALVAGGLYAAFRLGRSQGSADAAVHAEGAPARVVADAGVPEADLPLPAPEQVSKELRPVCVHPLCQRLLASPELLQWLAQLVDNLAQGELSRSTLAPVAAAAPLGRFSVVESAGHLHASPASFARYDELAQAIASLDVSAAASAFKSLRGPLQTAWRALGYPGGSLDEVLRAGLGRIEALPVPEAPPELVTRGAGWGYADPKLEALGPVEKQLLRMGPKNARLVQEKARALRRLL